MFDHIDPRSAVPLYAQIASRLRAAIAGGQLAPGTGLPSVRQLASQLRINPATVVQAYRELEREGFVAIRQGSGTTVLGVAEGAGRAERVRQARALVRRMLEEAGRLRISGEEVREALVAELGSEVKP